MNINIYTDASFSKEHKLAACGYIIFVDGTMEKHEIVLVGSIATSDIAEVLAIEYALSHVQNNLPFAKCINVNTDYKPIALLAASKSPKPMLKQLLQQISYFSDLNIGVTIAHVKGHRNNKNNLKVDKSVRKALRKHLKEK